MYAGSTTEVSIVCFPTSPVSLSESSWSSIYSLSVGGEKWFTFIPGTTSTDVTVQPTSGSVTMGLFGPDGLLISGTADISLTETLTIITDPGSNYYVAIASNIGGSFKVMFTWSGIPPSDDYYEENDTLATAYSPFPEITWLSTINGMGIALDDDWYHIVVTSNFNRILIDCTFSHTSGDVDIALVDSSGNILVWGSSVTDDEHIDYIVDPAGGDYYIYVYPYGSAHGNSYDLWWDDIQPSTGTGTIDIILE